MHPPNILRRVNKSSLLYFLTMVVGLSSICVAFSSAEEKTDVSIFKYKKELSITATQEKNLRGILSKLSNYLEEKTQELNRHRDELNKMIADKASLRTIRAKLRTIARLQADATYEDIASVRAIGQELTAEQMSRWRGMQEDFRKKTQQAQAVKAEQKGVAR